MYNIETRILYNYIIHIYMLIRGNELMYIFQEYVNKLGATKAAVEENYKREHHLSYLLSLLLLFIELILIPFTLTILSLSAILNQGLFRVDEVFSSRLAVYRLLDKCNVLCITDILF